MKSINKFIYFILILVACGNKDIEKKEETAKDKVEKKDDVSASIRQFNLIKQLPHDETAYTQGLILYNDLIYESTGQYGKSSIRKIDPNTGLVLALNQIPNSYFGEGITILNNKIYMLTWQSHQCLIINIETLKIEDAFSYSGEGWGLTDDGQNLIMSDGSNTIKYIDPIRKNIIKILSVSYNGKPVYYLNELEYVNGKIFANIYESDQIAIINEQNGIVEKFIDLSELRNYESNNPYSEVLNGIAYNKKDSTFIVTGKNWSYYSIIKIN